jgi:precorrin-2/cobalt-factor-2 C20-methyltransferase
MSGRLYGIGVGPGDPELMTLKAIRLLGEADVVAYPTAKLNGGLAIAIAGRYLRPEQQRMPLVYPTTAGPGADAPDYRARMRAFYDETAARLAEPLERGATVALLCEGDPFFFGSFIYWHARLAPRFPTLTVPGISSVMAAPAAAGRPLCRQDDMVTVIPGTRDEDTIAMRLREAEAAVVTKLGRTFAKVRRALAASCCLDRAIYVERATWIEERVLPASEVDPERVPYFSVVVVPSRTVE